MNVNERARDLIGKLFELYQEATAFADSIGGVGFSTANPAYPAERGEDSTHQQQRDRLAVLSQAFQFAAALGDLHHRTANSADLFVDAGREPNAQRYAWEA